MQNFRLGLDDRGKPLPGWKVVGRGRHARLVRELVLRRAAEAEKRVNPLPRAAWIARRDGCISEAGLPRVRMNRDFPFWRSHSMTMAHALGLHPSNWASRSPAQGVCNGVEAPQTGGEGEGSPQPVIGP